nr:MAG TPA: hypothetical protein [Caudoviricetes sp.]
MSFPIGVDCGRENIRPARGCPHRPMSKFVYPMPLAGFRRLQ